jgi:hypothetical protein
MDWTMPYLAGAIDSDGSIGIKRHSYRMRVTGDAANPCYSERICLKQVTPQIPHMLKDAFGGMIGKNKAQSENGKPLWSWQCTDRQAARACEQLVPFLQVKKRQAQLCLDLRASKSGPMLTLAYWYAKDHPDWEKYETISSKEVLEISRYRQLATVHQAMRNGSLLALPRARRGKVRFCKPMIEWYMSIRAAAKGSTGYKRPAQLIAYRDSLYQECRELNRIGIGKHPITERTGCYAPLA